MDSSRTTIKSRGRLKNEVDGIAKDCSLNSPSPKDDKPKVLGNGFTYKVCILICMSFNNAGITLLVYYTKNRSDGPRYLSSTHVLSMEIVKLLISIVMLSYQSKTFSKLCRTILEELIYQPVEFLKISIPALLYAFQNRLVYVALQYLDPATYQVSIQLKILTTAVLMHVVLGKKLSSLQWFSLILLFFGVTSVHVKPQLFDSEMSSTSSWRYFIGLLIVLVCCLCSSLAGVYFEMILKSKQRNCSFWVRNLEMYIWGIITTGSGAFIQDYENIQRNGFFYGYTSCVWILLCISSLGGVFSSLIIRHLDNNFKSLGAAGGVLIAGYGSFVIFKNEIYIQFFGGSICVFMAIFLYLTK